MSERIRRILSRGIPLLILVGICVVAMLYHFAYFDLSFVERPDDANETTRAPEETKSPEQFALESQLAGLATGDSIGNIVVPGTTAGSADTAATVLPAYPELDALAAEGYDISYADWHEGMRFARVSLAGAGFTPQNKLETGKKTIYALRTMQYEADGERFVYESADTTTRLAVELYGGYIIADLGSGTLALANSDGTPIGRYSYNDITPAYARNAEGNPLFRAEEEAEDGELLTVYYYLDATGALVRSDYDPEVDSRGLSFDYTPDYGQSDNNLTPNPVAVTEQVVDQIDKTNWYTLSYIDHELAEAIYRIDPEFAEKVAGQNPRFERALREAIVRVHEEQEAETTAFEETTEPLPETTAPVPETTAAPETTLSAPETTVPAPETETTPEPETTVPEPETTEAETTQREFSFDDIVLGVTANGQEILVIDALSGTLRERVLVPDELTEEFVEAIESTEETTVPVEETAAPVEETTAPVEETTAPVEETTAPVEETTAPVEETTVPVEETAAPVEETTVPVEETAAPVEETTAPAETTSPISMVVTPDYTVTDQNNIITVTRTLPFVRWGFKYMTSGWTFVGANYSRTFAYREGRACAVDKEGRLIFLGTNGYRALPTFSWANEWVYMTNQNSRYVVASYVEPLMRDITDLGHYYYDHGYVRVRMLERDYSYRNIVTADEELLIDINGSEFEIPAGYTLVGYADGVLLLEREGKYGYYHIDGHWIAQPIYTYAQPFMEGVGVIGFKDGCSGAVDTSGRILIPFVYEYISAPSTGIIACWDSETGWEILAKVEK